jgi:hypothetical protein
MTTTSDTEYRCEFFVLLAEKLEAIILGDVDPDTIDLSEDERQAIEYFLKDVSPRLMSVHASNSICIGQFRFDLRKISQGDEETLMIYEEAFKSSRECLGMVLEVHLRATFRYAHQQRGGPIKKDDGASENPWMR